MQDLASNYLDTNHSVNSTRSALTGGNIMVLRYQKTRKCLGSKAALMVLLWSFFVLLVHFFITDLSSYRSYVIAVSIQKYRVAKSCFPAIFIFFYPVAGLLADLKVGRYRIIIASLWMLVAGTPFVLIGSALLMTITQFNSDYKTLTTFVSIGGFLAAMGLILLVCSFVVYVANIIQFGLDQLQDYPAEDQVIFIKWYIWTYKMAGLIQYAVIVVTEDPKVSWSLYYYILATLLTITAALLIGLLYITYRNKKWFFTNYRIINPYKLVYKVTRFACTHKTPVNRSAFTFCEDEIPSGLDLGKSKYGGPFTTEQVEDVKAFFGILRILFASGTVFFLDFTVNREAVPFALHINLWASGNTLQEDFIDNGLIYYLEVVFLYPIYLMIIRPLISYYIPSSLYYMGLGMLAYILVILMSLGMDVTAHAVNPKIQCIFYAKLDDSFNDTFSISTKYLASSFYYMIIIQQTVYAFSNVVVMTSMYEFIFAQCPHAMKGFMMGLSFTIVGIYKALGSLFIVPFLFYSDSISSPSCGTVYYSANIVIGLVALMVFVYQVKRYKHRMRDEPCHVHRYVEEYYSKIVNDSAPYI